MSDRKIKKAAACLTMGFVLAVTGSAGTVSAQESVQDEQQTVVQLSKI